MNHKRNIIIGVLIALAIVLLCSVRMATVVVGGLTAQDKAAAPYERALRNIQEEEMD